MMLPRAERAEPPAAARVGPDRRPRRSPCSRALWISSPTAPLGARRRSRRPRLGDLAAVEHGAHASDGRRRSRSGTTVPACPPPRLGPTTRSARHAGRRRRVAGRPPSTPRPRVADRHHGRAAPAARSPRVDVRGGGPGTRETDALDARNLVDRIHAVCLTGGSAYGLAAADGVMAHLERKRLGFRVGPEPAACRAGRARPR